MQWLFGRGGLFTNLRSSSSSSSITKLDAAAAGGGVVVQVKTINNRYIEFNNNNNKRLFGGGGGYGGRCCYTTTNSNEAETTTTTGSVNSSKSKRRKSSLLKKKLVIHDDDDHTPPTEEEEDQKKKNSLLLYYVVRKGDIVGVYNNLLDSQSQQTGSSVSDLPVSVYKGYNMSKEAEAYLLSRGLKHPLYSIRAVDFRQDLFGTLIPCPFQHPHVSTGEPEIMFPQLFGSPQTGRACILEFDGACKGNPGISGAGAVLRTPDGTLFCRLREGLGTATNNVAEYRAMILGLRYALSKGFTSIYVVGDSKLVCMQIQGLWRVRHPNIIKWYEEAKKLKDEFLFFQINHVLLAKNSAADAQANLAVVLAVGEVQEEEEDVDTMKSDSQSQQLMELINFNLQPNCQ